MIMMVIGVVKQKNDRCVYFPLRSGSRFYSDERTCKCRVLRTANTGTHVTKPEKLPTGGTILVELQNQARLHLTGTRAKQTVQVFVLVLLLSVVVTAQERPASNSPQVASTPDSSLAVRLAIVRSRADGTPLVVIDKSDRKLSFFRSGELDTTFSAEFGRGRTDGDKVKEGDWRTPEGEFRICYRNSSSRFYKALLLNYPLIEDAERGLKDRIIERSDYQRILAAHETGDIPDQYTGLGGLIEIHGRAGVGFDWTRGCIAVSNSGIDYLFKHTQIGTKVVITE